MMEDGGEDDEKVLHASGWDHVKIKKPETAKYAITGHESQVITLALDVGDTCKGEPGTMMYLTNGMTQSVTCDGCWARCCAGEDCFGTLAASFLNRTHTTEINCETFSNLSISSLSWTLNAIPTV